MLRKIASIFVEMRAPREQLANDLRTAEGDVRASTQRIRTESAGGVSGFTAGLKEATKPGRDLVNIISALVGGVTRVLGIIGLVSSALYGVYSVVENILTYSDRVADSAKRARSELAGMRADAASSGAGSKDYGGGEIEAAMQRLDELQRKRTKNVKETQEKLLGSDSFKKTQERINALYKAINSGPESRKDSGFNKALSAELQKEVERAENLLNITVKDAVAGIDADIAKALDAISVARFRASEKVSNEIGEMLRPLEEIGGAVGDALQFDASNGFLAASESAQKFKDIVAKIFADFEAEQVRRLKYEDTLREAELARIAAVSEAERAAMRQIAQEKIAQVEAFRANLEAIGRGFEPGAIGAPIERLNMVLEDISRNLSVLSRGVN
jgi:hypothetical protein